MREQIPDLDERLDFALRAAREAAEPILDYYHRNNLAIELKDDKSPVTAADREAEELIRNRLQETFPGDGILGEEFDEKPSKNRFRWILDPIDGTQSFVHGVPLFGTLIGLEYGDRIVAGVCRFPALDETVYAAEGSGTWLQQKNGEPRSCRVTGISQLSEALLCFTEVEGFRAVDRHDAFEALTKAARMTRGWGDCYGHMLVATGRADAMVDPRLSPWDAAALLPILQEAGGHFVDWSGHPTIHGGNGVSVGAALKDEVIKTLRR